MILFIRWILSICLAYPLSACRWYPIPINFNDERGQFNTSWTHCSKVVGNKSYALVTEKCMTQISAGVICYTPACPSTRLPSLRCIRAHAHTHTHICTLHALQLGNAISFWCAIRIQPPGYLVNGDTISFFLFFSLLRLSYFSILSFSILFCWNWWNFFFFFFGNQLQTTRLSILNFASGSLVIFFVLKIYF